VTCPCNSWACLLGISSGSGCCHQLSVTEWIVLVIVHLSPGLDEYGLGLLSEWVFHAQIVLACQCIEL
jgi:hypothetical protein